MYVEREREREREDANTAEFVNLIKLGRRYYSSSLYYSCNSSHKFESVSKQKVNDLIIRQVGK